MPLRRTRCPGERLPVVDGASLRAQLGSRPLATEDPGLRDPDCLGVGLAKLVAGASDGSTLTVEAGIPSYRDPRDALLSCRQQHFMSRNWHVGTIPPIS